MEFVERKTFRFEIELNLSEHEEPTVVNYKDLVEKESSSRSEREGDLPASPNRHSDLPQGTQPLPEVRRKPRKWDIADFRKLATGYREDSFIDNSETCDESVTSSRLYLGYCLHSKSESISDLDSDIESESFAEPCSNSSESEFNTDQSKLFPNTPEFLKLLDNISPITSGQTNFCVKVPPSLSIFPVVKPVSKVVKENVQDQELLCPVEPEVINLDDIPSSDPIKDSSLPPKESTSATSLAESNVSGEEPSCSGLAFVEEDSGIYAYEDCPEIDISGFVRCSYDDTSGASQSTRSDDAAAVPDSSCNAQPSAVDETEDKKNTPQLPLSVSALLSVVMSAPPPDKKKNMPENSEILLKLGDECRKMPAASRMFVYEQVARHWDCTVKAVSKRIGRLRSQLDERPVKDCLTRLRSQLAAETKIGLNRNQEADAITSTTAELLRATLLAKSRWLERHPPRKGDAAQALLRFVREELLVLWTPGAGEVAGAGLAAAHVAAHAEVARLLAQPVDLAPPPPPPPPPPKRLRPQSHRPKKKAKTANDFPAPFANNEVSTASQEVITLDG